MSGSVGGRNVVRSCLQLVLVAVLATIVWAIGAFILINRFVLMAHDGPHWLPARVAQAYVDAGPVIVIVAALVAAMVFARKHRTTEPR